MDTFVVGITGGSASGKTSFLQKLVESFKKGNLSMISLDNYYKPRHLQPLDDNNVHNFDTPLSIDFELLAKDIETLKNGQKVTRPNYNYNNDDLPTQMITYHPAPIIIVEGLFVFYVPHINNLLDFRIFIDAKEFIKIKRRIARDKEERGFELDDVLYRYENHVAPSYEKYIEPFKNEADVVIPNNSSFNKALAMIVAYLKTKVNG